MASQYPPKKNAGYTFYTSLVSQANTKIMQANPTLAAGDVKVTIDDGAPANLATLPVVDADFTKRVKVVLSSSEMNGDNISVIFSDASGNEWCDQTINIQTTARQIDDLAYPATSGRSLAVDTNGRVDLGAWLGATINALISGRVDANTQVMAQSAADVVWTSATRTITAFSHLVSLASTEFNAIADAVLKRDFSSVTGEAARSIMNAMRFLRNKRSIATGVLTVTKEDDTTTAWTASVTENASANPVTGIDPN